MYFFTADEHYGHKNIIEHCNRPFRDVHEMDLELIRRHNEVVEKDDVVVHAGDFSWGDYKFTIGVIGMLNGCQHIFLRGCHDDWIGQRHRGDLWLWQKKTEGVWVVVCHYPMRSWPRSVYGSWQVHGHSHGKLPRVDGQWDVGVDNNDFYPVSFKRLREVLSK